MAAVQQYNSIRDEQPREGRHLWVTGQVQGVGFRPFVHNLATRLGLHGSVSNDATGVQIDVVGAPRALDAFEQTLLAEAPSMALIDGIEVRALQNPDNWPKSFTISASGGGDVQLSVTPDATVCPACLNELFDPNNRRYRYPFINCTHCGPRYSLIRALPYDRPNTTMAAFSLCEPCATEYKNPADRRFHAQPTCCEACGPQLSLYDQNGNALAAADPIAQTLADLQAGKIIAIKGIGGFHLVCDANDASAVARLRTRKQREEKPFAVMGANLASLRTIADVSETGARRLQALDAPILLCSKRTLSDDQRPMPEALPGVAPGLAWLGVMLPHSPLHYLLFHQAAGSPSGTEWLDEPQSLLLVMTSGNRSGEPLVTDNQHALEKLHGMVDGWLMHDRDIHTRSDDSVVHGGCEPPAVIRRGRGLAPRVLPLPDSGPPGLALGPFFKNTLCVTKDARAYVSQYIGDLDNASNCRTLEQTADHLCNLMAVEPQWIAVDRHPDFYSTRLGRQLAAERGLPVVEVQHHHAHIAAVMAEHQLQEPALGVALDGLGLGDNDELWGGELLRVFGAEYQRMAHIAPLLLPGGDRAAREPWRLGASVLHQLGHGDEIEARFVDQPGASLVRQMLDRRTNCPATTSMGRWFDAAAGILGIKPMVAYEAQAAMLLEGLADRYGAVANEPLLPTITDDGTLDLLPLFARLLTLSDSAQGAALFQSQLSRALAKWVGQQAERISCKNVVLAGGCFLNQRLRRELTTALERIGMNVYCAQQLPCNDGGISLGQAWVAIQQMKNTVA